MSFDLYLYLKKEEDFDVKKIQDFLQNELAMHFEQEEKCWKYKQPYTGVNFNLFQDEAVQFLENKAYEGFKFSGFSLRIYSVRANFFGKECLQVLKAIYEQFSFYILNAQDEEAFPKTFDEEELFSTWKKQNEQATKTLFQLSQDAHMQAPDFVKEQQSNYFWNYSFNRKIIEENLNGRDIFIPSLMFVKRKSDAKIKTLVVWTDSTPLVFPKVDYFIIQKIVGEGVSDLEGGFVAFDLVMEKIAPYVKKYEGPVEEMYIIEDEASEQARDVFYDLEFEARIRDFAVQVEPQNLVNIKP